MKFLLLLIFSFSASAGMFIPQSEIGDCSNSKSYKRRGSCKKESGEKCIKLPKKYDCNHYVLADEMIDDPEDPIFSKNESESCSDEDDCQEKLESKVCSDSKESPIMTEDEVYCSKMLGYNQIKSGKKIASFDQAKKDAHDAQVQSEKDAKDQERADRKAEIQEIKGFIQNVNDSDLPNWHKKILKKLIRDLK